LPSPDLKRKVKIDSAAYIARKTPIDMSFIFMTLLRIVSVGSQNREIDFLRRVLKMFPPGGSQERTKATPLVNGVAPEFHTKQPR
jgi:hypothetical protein